MKKKVRIVLSIVLLIILLFPLPYRIKDGGSVEYKAILYSVKDVHSLNPDINSEQKYIEGIVVKILGFEIFNNVK
ncbi:MAG: hypothetical protein ACI4R6_07450 [Lachnospiraceae bacterium]